MANIDSAKAAIEAEIGHARKGLDFYQTRVEGLQRVLESIASIDGKSSHIALAGTAPQKRGRKPKAANQVNETAAKASGGSGAKRKGRGSAAASGGNDLPFTGGSYWSDLITSEPKSAGDVRDAAVAALGFTPTKQQVQKLANRMTFALNALVKSGEIRDSGHGRERRFFKA
jgi:hypothetical protein